MTWYVDPLMGRSKLQEHLNTLIMNKVIERMRVDPWEGKYGYKLRRRDF